MSSLIAPGPAFLPQRLFAPHTNNVARLFPEPSDRFHPALEYMIDLKPDQGNFLADVLAGLADRPRSLSPKYFYDRVGSALFDAICDCDEYYVTRTEMALLQDISADIAALTGAHANVIEYGAGSGWKIRLLLQALDQPAEYAALDISRDHLEHAVGALAQDFPAIRIGCICADFTRFHHLPDDVAQGKGQTLGFMPGSTIGNLDPEQAVHFLGNVKEQMGPGGALLIGADLKKDHAILQAAYNDKAGHTAAFNLNLLKRMEQELGAKLDQGGFAHHAFYNEQAGRVEMHLIAEGTQTIEIEGNRFTFQDGETLHTENSHKFTIAEFQDLARKAGFLPEKVWTDAKKLFSIHFLSVPQDG